MSWLDDFGDTDWTSALAALGAPGDLGDFVYFDTDLGDFVDASQVDPSMVQDLDLSGSGSGPVGSSSTGGSLDTSPISRSTSDMLRSLEGSPTTWAPGAEPFDLSQMADPSASIDSASGSNWLKSLASGLGSALSGVGSGLSGLTRGAGDAGGVPGASPMMGASVPGVGAPGDAGGVGGLSGLIRPGMQDALGAAYASLTPAQRAQLGMQAPIDPGPAPVKFTPLQMASPSAGVPMAGVAPQRMSGLQRLLSERLG